eukprot:CAMPEP_0198307550 /NCGR_PEP_ID=MMETSP1450-20131203/407_1 /TAXON_ID=753684 ORGANISM="Madagascaria erythrocladiodes, Strain CCMP3234" /NCGR_SAMPLE_ID=MMETSP1450 /ASSEMBLY_ACC=CAM_ASM_001115 /LENGTH=461 /DNA_ID=CAMNT_0044010133 /DNA_START=8 /DNA_END=1389 /DNA_ORIENTATION=+
MAMATTTVALAAVLVVGVATVALAAEGEPAWKGLTPDRIGARSPLCDDKSALLTKIGDYLCDDKLNALIDKLGISLVELGPCTTLCRAFGCAQLALGCGAEFKALEAKVSTAQCAAGIACADFAGLSDSTCDFAVSLLMPNASTPALPNLANIGDAGFLTDEFLPWLQAQAALCNNPASLTAIVDLVDGSSNDLFGADLQAIVQQYQTPCGTVCESGVCALKLIGCETQAEQARRYRDNTAAGVAACGGLDAAALQCQGSDPCEVNNYRPTAEKCTMLPNCPPLNKPWHTPAYASGGTAQLSIVEQCCPTVCEDECAGKTCTPAAGNAGGPNGEAPVTVTGGDVDAARATCTATAGFDLRCNRDTGCYYCTEPCKNADCGTDPTCPAGQVLAQAQGGCCNVCTTCGAYQVAGRCPTKPDPCPAGTKDAAACTGAACNVADDCCNRCVADTDAAPAPGAATP